MIFCLLIVLIVPCKFNLNKEDFMININSKAPSIDLITDKDFFSLKKYKGKNIVVFFFPKADTSGCTSEAISFSELKEDFDKLDTLIIGISKDTQQKQIKFKEKYNLSCILGSDNDGKICEKYGTWVEKSMYGKKYMGIQRSTFLIDKKGIVNFIWPKVKVPGHAKEVLEKIKSLK